MPIRISTYTVRADGTQTTRQTVYEGDGEGSPVQEHKGMAPVTNRHFGRYVHHVPALPGNAAATDCVTENDVDGHDPETAQPLVLQQTIKAVKAAGFEIDAELWGMADAAECNQCHAGCHDSPKKQ
jgi:hypothetical protein